MRLLHAARLSKNQTGPATQDQEARAWAEAEGKKLIVVNPELVWPPAPGDTATPIVWDALVGQRPWDE